MLLKGGTVTDKQAGKDEKEERCHDIEHARIQNANAVIVFSKLKTYRMWACYRTVGPVPETVYFKYTHSVKLLRFLIPFHVIAFSSSQNNQSSSPQFNHDVLELNEDCDNFRASELEHQESDASFQSSDGASWITETESQILRETRKNQPSNGLFMK